MSMIATSGRRLSTRARADSASSALPTMLHSVSWSRISRPLRSAMWSSTITTSTLWRRGGTDSQRRPGQGSNPRSGGESPPMGGYGPHRSSVQGGKAGEGSPRRPPIPEEPADGGRKVAEMRRARGGRLPDAEALVLHTEYRRTGDARIRDRLVIAYAGIVKHIAYRKIRELPAWCEVD